MRLSFSPSFSLGIGGTTRYGNRFNGFFGRAILMNQLEKPLKRFAEIIQGINHRLKPGENEMVNRVMTGCKE